MSKTVEIGRRVVPVEQIALIEMFDPEAQKNMQSTRPFKTRIVMVGRDSILSERDVPSLSDELGFRHLPNDGVATNPTIRFTVERFEPSADFQPAKPFVSRLMWKDGDGNTQSKLMLSEVEDLVATTVRGEVPSVDGPGKGGRSSSAPRPRRRRPAAAAPPQPQG
ncbi:hypothetical protein [Bradyrhizobium acaciae]|uniref:hypothetical protein n=1 Tax=Bradyrhizobium acaciae TaxID=2683706 RepID=UPI001E5ED4AB|nr:hypothetical protein [Bradyrhizobium acaciae]MCC8978878.1 hypothetical protein [Bradyrhizobium acaciae]